MIFDDISLSILLTAWKRIKLPNISHRPIVLNGAWRPSDDQVEVKDNFVTMQNLYYGETHPIPVPGMTKVTSAIPSVTCTADVEFLCHCNELPFADPVGSHTITNTSVTLDQSNKKMGNGSSAYNGAAKLVVSSHADFNLSAGVGTISFWVYATTYNGTAQCFVAVVGDANNYIKIGFSQRGIMDLSCTLTVNMVIGGVEKIGATGLEAAWSAADGISSYMNKWTHVRFVENGDNVYLFVDGVLKDSDTITGSARMPDANATVNIGVDQTGSAGYFTGNIDEIITSKTAESTTDFTPAETEESNTLTVSTPVVYSGIQYVNDRFDENAVLAQCANAGETASYIIKNTTTVPSTGNFSATPLFELTEDEGRFSKAPGNNILFCNGEENLIWGGTEVLPVGVINKAEDGSFDYNFTDVLTNSINDSENSAAIHNVASSVTTSMLSVFHFENNLTEEVAGRSTSNSNVVYSSTIKAVGSYSANFKRRNSAYFTITTLTTYDFSTLSMTLARYVRIKDLSGYNPLFYQFTTGSEATDYMLFTIVAGVPTFTIVAGGVTVVSLTAPALKADKWYFLAIAHDAANGEYYILCGLQGEKIETVAQVTDAQVPAAYNSNIYIGTDKSSGGNFANCFMDELIDANALLYDLPFPKPQELPIASLSALGSGGDVGRLGLLYVITSRPIDAIKPYIRTANEQVKTINFATGTEELVAGDQIFFGTTGGTATVLNVLVSTGSWSGNDATGVLTITSPTATPQAAEDICKYVQDGDEYVLTTMAVTANPTGLASLTAAVAGYYWGENGWTSVGTITDGTLSGSIPLSATGVMSFASTIGLARQTMNHGVKAYHYKFVLTNISDTTELYQLTVRCPMQEITDIWDGVGVPLMKVWKYDYSSKQYHDYTVNAAIQDYQPFPVVVDGATMEVAFRITYINIASFAASNDELIFGSQVRLAGVICYMAEKVNTNNNTVTQGYTFDGSTWVAAANYKDGTQREGTTKAFAQTGYITWDSPDAEDEFKTRVKDEPYFYYYKIKVVGSSNLDSNCRIDCLMGIPAEKTIRPYKFPVGAWDVVYLCNNKYDRKNAVRPADPNTATVWREEILVGTERELTAGCCIPSQLVTAATLMFKATETWCLMGRYPNITTVQLSDTDGCPAPKTLKTTSLPIDIAHKFGLGTGVAIWQGTNGFYISDGKVPIPIGWAMRKYFDPNKSACIPAAMIGESIAWMDNKKWRYHVRIASGSGVATLNTELVFDLRKMEWSEVVRGTGNDLQYALEVEDAYGNPYQYGFTTAGYMERLDYGTSFDGQAIVGKIRLGDIAPHGDDPFWETRLESIDVLMAAKETTANKLAVTHYLDTDTTGTSLTSLSCSSTGKRLTMVHRNVNEQGTYHGIELSLTTSDETESFEPLGINLHYQDVR